MIIILLLSIIRALEQPEFEDPVAQLAPIFELIILVDIFDIAFGGLAVSEDIRYSLSYQIRDHPVFLTKTERLLTKLQHKRKSINLHFESYSQVYEQQHTCFKDYQEASQLVMYNNSDEFAHFSLERVLLNEPCKLIQSIYDHEMINNFIVVKGHQR